MIAAAKEPRGDVVEIPFAGHNFRVAVAPLSGIIRDVKIDGAWWSAREVLSSELIAELQRELAGMPSNA